jgi:hypothetical protein
VIGVSRAHSIWIRADVSGPRYFPPVTVPRPAEQSGSARVELEFRGADGFTPEGEARAFDARQLDPLGDAGTGNVFFHGNDATWHSRIEEIDGAQFIQVRFSFVNDLAAEVTPVLSALGIAYEAE